MVKTTYFRHSFLNGANQQTPNSVLNSISLQITAVLSCFHINPFVNVPITIGSYPLLGNTNPPTEKNINTKFAPPVMQTLYPAVPSAPALSYELQQPLLLPQNEKEPFPPIPAGQYLPPGQPEPEPYAGEGKRFVIV